MSSLDFKTYNHKPADKTTAWHLIDAGSMPLGRLAVEVAKLLIGKQKPTYTPHVDDGDWVIVLNSDQLLVSGNKNKDKIYYRHSGYVGHLRSLTLTELHQRDSRKVIHLAVKGMLPKNKLQALRLKRLKIYTGKDHPHSGQQPKIYQTGGGQNAKR